MSILFRTQLKKIFAICSSIGRFYLNDDLRNSKTGGSYCRHRSDQHENEQQRNHVQMYLRVDRLSSQPAGYWLNVADVTVDWLFFVLADWAPSVDFSTFRVIQRTTLMKVLTTN